jgi:1,4-dihydroxy-2-naphthoate octaprenyltransferase
VHKAALVRLPLLGCALLAALVGVALAAHLAGPLVPWRVAAVLAGALLAQLGSNAWHDLHVDHPAGKLGAPRLGRRALWRLVWIGYLPAVLLGALLAWGNPAVLLFAAAGVAVSLLFVRFRAQGWGPLFAGLTYGPLLAEGALHAVLPGTTAHLGHLVAAAWTLPVGLLAAAILYLDDLADRPLDQAGGQRTLLVRLPEARHWLGLASLLLPAALLAVALGATAGPAPLLGALVLLLACVALLLRVRHHLQDPHALAPDRLAAVLLHLATAALTILALLLPGAPA